LREVRQQYNSVRIGGARCRLRGLTKEALATRVLLPVTPLCLALICLAFSFACDIQRRKSDAELGLTPQQAAGRRIYDDRCDRCHEPYSTKGKKGPGLKGMFKNPYLSLSGLPANDERVLDIISHGRNEMPGYSQVLTQQQMADLLAYLHTL